MRRISVALLVALCLLGLSGLALKLTSAAPLAQTTRTPRASATATPRPTRTPLTRATAASTALVTASPSVVTDDDATTATPTPVVSPTEVLTDSLFTLEFEADEVDPARTLTVVGLGVITATPDVAVISLGMEAVNADIEVAVEENEASIAAILALIEELGIPSSNVQTSQYNIYVERASPEPLPRDTEEETEPAAPLYHVSQQVTVRVEALEENLTLLSDLLQGAIEAGANQVYGPSFELADTGPLQSRARRAAVADAYERAQAWALLAGVEVVGVASMSEVIGGGGPGPIPVAQARESLDSAAGSSIQPGTLRYSEQIQIVFYIR